MGFPLFKFTLNSTTSGVKVISEPGGWDEAILKLERNEEYHSLVEFYDQPLTFYGADSTTDGGYDYIKGVEAVEASDAQINILVEISEDEGATYTTCYDGLLDITTIKEIDFYKLECGVIRNDFWQKFMNRRATPVDLSSTIDLDGNAIAAVSPITMALPNQVITQYYESYNDTIIQLLSTGTEQVIQLGTMDIIVLDEVGSRNTTATTFFTAPFIEDPTFGMDFSGAYTFDIRIEISILSGGVYSNVVVPFYFYVNGVAVTAFSVSTAISGPDSSSIYTYSATISLSVGDTISVAAIIAPIPGGDSLIIYGRAGASTPPPPSGASRSTYFNITANTTYPDSSAEVFRVFDAGDSIISRCVGQAGALVSDYIYPNSGCGGYYNIMKGLHVRGYSLADKPFTLSFNDFWNGMNPIHNLGLGYEVTAGIDHIRIEDKAYFYDPSVSINFDYINKIERGYDTSKIAKSIEIGFEKWSAESASGVDDPQTKHTYRTRFKTIGEDVKLLSKFYAASLGIEQTRRNRATLGKDWRLDEDVIIIAFSQSNQGTPELAENFVSVSNLLNYATRYNLRITPGRNFFRWRDFFNCSLVPYSSNNNFYFAGGEGNITMASDYAEPDCDAPQGDEQVSFAENQDIFGGAGHTIFYNNNLYFIPTVYTFEHPLTYTEYSTILANRTKAIGISRTNSGHVACFIQSLEYSITHGKGKFKVILGQTSGL